MECVMNSLNKNVVIAVAALLLVLAIFSFKKFVLDAGSADAAKAEISKQLKDAPAANTDPPPVDKPSSAGLHQPGNKNH